MEAQFADDFSNGDLYDAWNHILSHTTAAHAQLTHEWLSSCWDVFRDNNRLSLITVTDGGEIVGIAPLIVSKVVGKAGVELRKLTFVGDGLTDYHDLLVADEKREEIVRVLLECIVKEKRRWDAIHLRNVRGDSPNLPIVREVLQESSFAFSERVNIQCPYVAIDGDWTDYYGALDRKMRAEMRRQSRRLAEMGKVEFVRLHDIDDVAHTLAIIKSIHVKCRGAKGGASWYADEKRFKFASLIVKRFGDRKWLDILFLKLNGSVIAYHIYFVYNNIVYWWNTGFDPEFSHLGPGKLLLQYGLQDSFAKRNKEFDFMVGEEPYKLRWTGLARPNYEVFAFKNTVRSHLLRCYHTCKPVLKRNPCLRKVVVGIKSKAGVIR